MTARISAVEATRLATRARVEIYQILKTYKRLTSAFRNWKRNKGEPVGSIEEYRGFIIEDTKEYLKHPINDPIESFVFDFNSKKFILHFRDGNREYARANIDEWIKEQAQELIASQVDE